MREQKVFSNCLHVLVAEGKYEVTELPQPPVKETKIV